MKKLIASLVFVFASFSTAFAGPASTISFNGDEYIYRATERSSHQYTPVDQTDLSSRQAMLSFSFAEEVRTKADLRKFAEQFLSGFHGKGKIIKAIAGPNPSDPELFFLAMMNVGEKSSDANMFLIGIENSTGVVMNYSHRFYGKDQSEAVSDWFNANGRKMEASIMSFKSFPSAEEFK